jgi:hypothetical protein
LATSIDCRLTVLKNSKLYVGVLCDPTKSGYAAY